MDERLIACLACLCVFQAGSAEGPAPLPDRAPGLSRPRKTYHDLSRALQSHDLAQRREAAKTLACVQAPLLPLLPALRVALQDEDEIVRGLIRAALDHLMITDAPATQAVFLKGLSSGDSRRRRDSAQEIERFVYALWDDTLSNRLRARADAFAEGGIPEWRPYNRDPTKGYPLSAQVPDRTFVAALATAFEDPDPEVRLACARALRPIAAHIAWWNYHDANPLLVIETEQLGIALERGAKAVAADDAALARALKEQARLLLPFRRRKPQATDSYFYRYRGRE